MLFLNVSAGLGLISQMSPISQDLYKPLADAGLKPEDLVKVLAVAGGSVVAYSAIFNGLGRLIWARISDTIGRKAVFLIMFASQAVIYALVAAGVINGYYIFLMAACYLLACYGGGFATMPAFCADSFGPGYIGKVYGFMLTAWACAGILGPLVFAQLARSTALYVAACLLVLGFIIAIVFKPPQLKKA
jgi:OFA family oxalate/formate antiporter-like MFS transporter